ncbi:hypothetical protein, partial [Zavarzinella formosa]|uniref:hypothetical protein n=1 Tax=Zavarzinella formosa TaxID=360055 RepID=UPI001EE67643
PEITEQKTPDGIVYVVLSGITGEKLSTTTSVEPPLVIVKPRANLKKNDTETDKPMPIPPIPNN